ncbi:MAG: chemotaxis protein CheA, partial [Pseudomonas sp.]|uniref:chemotaxis protein CheA n=1 Tax=Pseudomonas sp. TaxID=306 RepID=UPI003982736E
MNDGLNQFLGVFFEEAEEHLANLENLLLTLNLQEPDPEALNGIFRAAHSIKGSSGMFGFTELTAVTHVLETLLDNIRSGKIQLQAEMIDVFLEARDVLAQLLDSYRTQEDTISVPTTAITQRLQGLVNRYSPGSATVVEDTGYGLFNTDSSFEPEEPAADDDAYGLFGETVTAALPPTEGDTAPAFGFFDDTETSQASTSAATTAPAPTPSPKASPRVAASEGESSSIRVSVERIDSLINQVGELVITQAMLAQLSLVLDPSEHERIFQALNQLDHNTRELQEAVMSIRMLPISFIFNRFPRVVRDTANKLGKQVELVLRGEHTELDKGVIEKLTDPLTHIVRNSIDHGIESPAERLAAGKPEQGTVRMSAYHQGGRIVVEISDDGKGLSRERILAKARKKGMAISDDMADSDVWQLIFMPGFSTADSVTDLSGRGVGMDVVRRNITSIGGRIDISSATGLGTHITIRLPLTLAILDGMIVEVDKVHYVVPLTNIVESLQLKAEHLYSMSGSSSSVISVRNEYLPLLSLNRLLNLKTEAPPAVGGIVIILE